MRAENGACVIRGATVIDGKGGPPATGWAVAVEGKRIRYAGPDRADLEAWLQLGRADIHNLAGHTLLPGLINLHDHLTAKRTWGPLKEQFQLPTGLLAIRAARAALAEIRRGVTTVRETGSREGLAFAVRDAVESGVIPGPRVVPAGTPLGITGGHGRLTINADGVDGVRRAARQVLKAGAEWVKMFGSRDPALALDGGPANRATGEYTVPEFTSEEIRAACEEAHAWGKRVAIHCMGREQIRRAVLAGVDTVEHGTYLDDEVADLMRERGTALVPTVSGYRETNRPQFDRGKRWVEEHLLLVEPHFKSLQAAVRRGVRLGIGTDTAGDLVDEIGLLIEAGAAPMEALRGATSLAAEVLGLERVIGTIEEGKLADLVVVEGDPLADHRALRRVVLVVQSGRCSRPAEIAISDADETAEFNSLRRPAH